MGGFVGGTLKAGRRKIENMGWRDVITLDMDYATPDFESVIKKALDGKTYLLYGTHKYSPDKPRIRIVIPAARGMTPDEYLKYTFNHCSPGHFNDE